ncbi:MAG: protein kinase [Phycisphaerales bacterium]|nr:protein kinase [Phycisphaerales bacterium]MCB9862655.1 protein kinase [Phycisphaerales bacterium]
MNLHPDWQHTEPTPEVIEAALEALHRGSPGAFDLLLDPIADGSSGICSLFSEITSPAPFDVAPPTIPGYTIDRILAAGGMGVIFAAQQSGTRRPVAVKVIRGGFGGGAPMDRLFRREVETLVRLRHPNIANLYDAGTTREGAPFFAMELIDGRTLKDFMIDAGDVDLRTDEGRTAIRRFIDVCRAMTHAHQRGVIHCDLKPTNIMIAADGTPKVLDFGLSRLIDPEVSTIAATTSHRLVGTLAYMSPEQVNGPIGELDVRSDVYSLGVMLYELVCGQPPYRVSGSAIPAAIRMICETEPKRPASVRPALKGDLDAIVMKALEKDPDQRYQSAGELADDLERTLRGEPIEARADRFYLLRRTMYRYRVHAMVAVAFLAVLATATGVSSWFWYRANQEAKRAHKVGNTAISTLGELMDEIYELSMEMSNQPLRFKRLDAQLQRLTAAIDMDPQLQFVTWTLLDTQGRVAYAKGDWSRAEELFEQLLETAPADSEWATDAHVELCGLLPAEEAKPHYEACLPLDLTRRQRHRVTQLYATCLMEERRFAEALEVLESTQGLVSDIRRRIVVARAYDGLGQTDEANRQFRQILEYAEFRVSKNPKQYYHKYYLLLAQVALADSCFHMGNIDEALEIAKTAAVHADHVLELKPRYSPAMIATYRVNKILCDIYLDRGDFRLAWEAQYLMSLNIGRVQFLDQDKSRWHIEQADTQYNGARTAFALNNLDGAELRAMAAIAALGSVSERRRPPESEFNERMFRYEGLLDEIACARERDDLPLEQRRKCLETYLQIREDRPDQVHTEEAIILTALDLAAGQRAETGSAAPEVISIAQDALYRILAMGDRANRADALLELIDNEVSRNPDQTTLQTAEFRVHDSDAILRQFD